jgi:hypothetical protein
MGDSMSEARSDRQCRRCGRFFLVRYRQQVYCSRRCYHEDARSSANHKAHRARLLLTGIAPRYGTYAEIGRQVGLSRERVRQLASKLRPTMAR